MSFAAAALTLITSGTALAEDPVIQTICDSRTPILVVDYFSAQKPDYGTQHSTEVVLLCWTGWRRF